MNRLLTPPARLALAAVLLALGLVAGSSPAQALPQWRTTAFSYDNPRAWQPKVVGLRYARHAGFDRAVIDIRGRRPDFTIRYVRSLRYDGSGLPVRLYGSKKMLLTIGGVAHDNQGDSLYAGPRRARMLFPTLKAAAFMGDYEGVVSFGFGTDRRAPYRVFTLLHPTRIVVDWKH